MVVEVVKAYGKLREKMGAPGNQKEGVEDKLVKGTRHMGMKGIQEERWQLVGNDSC